MDELDATAPDDPATIEALQRVMTRPGYTVPVREEAFARLERHDVEELKKHIRRTLPQLGARGWVERLRARGVDALALPLIAIDAAPGAAALQDAWQRLGAYRAAMFVSGNAVRHFFAQRPPGARFDVRAWAPGPGTAEALRREGVDDALIDGPALDAAQFDSETLWLRVAPQVRAGDTVLIVPRPACAKCTLLTRRSSLWVSATSLRISWVRSLMLSSSELATRWMRATESEPSVVT